MTDLTERLSHSGAAVPTTLTTAMEATDTSFTVAALTNWPSYLTGPFYADIDAGTSSEEKILCQSYSGTVVTVASGGRGADGTTPSVHGVGATVQHVFTGVEADQANAHTSDTSGLHGVAGNVVGDSDTQTLTNKTLNNPTLQGSVASAGVSFTGGPTIEGGATLTAGPALSGSTMIDSGATLVEPTIANFTNAQHDHNTVPQGGGITQAVQAVMLADGVVQINSRETPGFNAQTPPAIGSGTFLIAAGVTPNDVTVDSSGNFTYNFPTAFPNGCLAVTANLIEAFPGGAYQGYIVITAGSHLRFQGQSPNLPSGTTSIVFSYIAIGW